MPGTHKEDPMTQDRSRNQPGEAENAADDGQRTDHPDPERHDPGAYIGREPERQAATIPGGISRKDERIAAHSTQSGPTAGDQTPDGHREGSTADDAQVREAGQSR
jgi:hypothetical protein